MDDCTILANALSGTNTAAALGWVTSTEQWCCSPSLASEVVCVDGKVAELRLGSKGIRGQLRVTFNQLKSLVSVDLSYNVIDGDLSFLAGSTSVRQVNLRACGVSGDLEPLRLLTQLSSLVLSDNRLLGRL